MTNTLATLVGSRICHDLISPICAINNGVELLSLSNGSTTDEIDLIGQSAEAASARIMFFRIAYGGAQDGQITRASEITNILEQMSKSGKYTYAWNSRDAVARLDTQAALLAIQCLETCLTTGGEIAIEERDGSWSLSAKGKNIRLNKTLWASLADPSLNENVTSAEVQFALLPLALSDMGRNLSYDASPNQFSISY